MPVDFDLFRENLELMRRMTGKTSRQLSEDLGMKQLKRVSDIEEGRGRPTLEEISATCDYFKVSIDDMLKRRVIIKFEFE